MNYIKSLISEERINSCFFRSSVKNPYRKVVLRITDRCNLHCPDCFMSATNHGEDMSIEIIQSMIPQLKKCRTYSVTLTGGEPFSHPKIVDIAALLINEKLKVSICTNGTLIQTEQIEKLSKLGNVHVNVSLHGFRSESHNKFTGDNTAFERTVTNIKKLSKNKILNGILVTPNSYADIKEYGELCEFAIENNASYVLMNPLSAMGRGVFSEKRIKAPYEMMLQIQKETNRLKDKIQIVFIRFQDAKLPLASCEVGNIIYILVNGNVTPCPYLLFAAETPNSKYHPNDFIIGNILTDSDISIRLDNYNFSKKYSLCENPVCNKCQIKEKCGKGCPAAVIFSGNKIGEIDRELCLMKGDTNYD